MCDIRFRQKFISQVPQKAEINLPQYSGSQTFSEMIENRFDIRYLLETKFVEYSA